MTTPPRNGWYHVISNFSFQRPMQSRHIFPMFLNGLVTVQMACLKEQKSGPAVDSSSASINVYTLDSGEPETAHQDTSMIQPHMDLDGDGETPLQGDCNDNDPEIYSNAEEHCDGVDNNCTGDESDCVILSVSKRRDCRLPRCTRWRHGIG